MHRESNNREKADTKQLEVREVNRIVVVIIIIITIRTTSIVLLGISDNTFKLFSSYRMLYRALFWKSPFPHLMDVILAC